MQSFWEDGGEGVQILERLVFTGREMQERILGVVSLF